MKSKNEKKIKVISWEVIFKSHLFNIFFLIRGSLKYVPDTFVPLQDLPSRPR